MTAHHYAAAFRANAAPPAGTLPDERAATLADPISDLLACQRDLFERSPC